LPSTVWWNIAHGALDAVIEVQGLSVFHLRVPNSTCGFNKVLVRLVRTVCPGRDVDGAVEVVDMFELGFSSRNAVGVDWG
jgi:hypothetical protein